MSTDDSIIGLYGRVDSMMAQVPKHPQAMLLPSELVTIGLLFALKGDEPRRFYRWLSANYPSWFPHLPERTRLFRLLATHADWTESFLAQPTLLGVADTSGIELRHSGVRLAPTSGLEAKDAPTTAGSSAPSWALCLLTPDW